MSDQLHPCFSSHSIIAASKGSTNVNQKVEAPDCSPQLLSLLSKVCWSSPGERHHFRPVLKTGISIVHDGMSSISLKESIVTQLDVVTVIHLKVWSSKKFRFCNFWTATIRNKHCFPSDFYSVLPCSTVITYSRSKT
jgi:hypothetical protein